MFLCNVYLQLKIVTDFFVMHPDSYFNQDIIWTAL